MGADLTGFGAAFGFGLFFFARGLGTGLGPILARNVFTNPNRWPSLVGQLIIASGFFYLLVGLTLDITLWLTVVLVVIAHSASGANWVLSTILTQQWVEDEIRGRVFSTDMLILSLAFSVSTSVAGYMMEYTELSIQNGVILFAGLMMLSGIVFTLWDTEKKSNQELVA
jgi:MFS family permease